MNMSMTRTAKDKIQSTEDGLLETTKPQINYRLKPQNRRKKMIKADEELSTRRVVS